MKNTQDIYNERLNRLKMAIELKKPDRVPVMAWSDAFAANHMGVKLSEFSTNPELATDTMVNSFKELSTFDASERPTTNPRFMAAGFLSKMKLAGKELPEGANWQIDEQERVSVEDYDKILKNGWGKFVSEIELTKLNFLPEDRAKAMAAIGSGVKKFNDAGIVVFAPATAAIPNEPIAAGRTMARFMTDLFRYPDKVEAVFDVIMLEMIEGVKRQIQGLKPLTVFFGMGRGAGEFYSSKLWERFIWKYLKKMVDVIIEAGSIPNLHIDANWERDLKYFRDLPKGKCLIAVDSATDIFKVKEVLGDRFCIKGDVPPALLTLGTPDEVYAYSAKLVKELGPQGFILAPGCTLPADSKLENVKAMLSAVTGK